MPKSNMSRMSVMSHSNSQSDVASQIAKELANKEINCRLGRGELKDCSSAEIGRIFREIYKEEYYRYYGLLRQADPVNRTIIQYVEHPAAKRYTERHTAVNFTRLNCLVHIHKGCITVGKFNYPMDEEESIETKEAFLSSWPGPLDQMHDDLKRRITDYLDTLLQHTSQKRIHYTIPTNDEHRKTILNLLAELLHRNGTIDAPGITKLLLLPEQTEIKKDESVRKPLETLQKYLLLGKRGEAIKYAKSKRLWDHAQCLAFLDKYQPPNSETYHRDTIRLRDDPLVQLNDEYISSLDPDNIIQVVYRSLLNRMLQSDPGSLNLVKQPNVENRNYEFAILSANDCDMDFDQTNEIFKLVMAVKNINLNRHIATNHLIQLGLTSLGDGGESEDDVSFPSLITYDPGRCETPSSRTLTISNVDMMILNEIWEYCQNLAWNTCNIEAYQYMINLIPYKLVFATRLLDFGELNKFCQYVNSMKYALQKAAYSEKDSYYDWQTIEESIEYLSGICDLFRQNPIMSPYVSSSSASPISPPIPSNQIASDLHCPPPSGYEGVPPQHSSMYNPPQVDSSNTDYIDSARMNYSYNPIPTNHYNNVQQIPQNNRTLPTHVPWAPVVPNQMPISHQPIAEEQDFNPEPEVQQLDNHDRQQDDAVNSGYTNDYSNETSRRTSLDAPVPPTIRAQAYPYPPEPEHITKTMKSSSPVHKNYDTRPTQQSMSESFSLMSPINPSDNNTSQPQITSPPYNSRVSNTPAYDTSSAAVDNNKSTSAGTSASQAQPNNNYNSNNNNTGSQRSSGDAGKQIKPSQSSGLLTNVLGSVGAFLPRSNSKQMILPDDSKKNIEYDEERGAWIDKNNPDAEAEAINEPPPMMPVQKAPAYSFANRSTKSRYPKSQIGP